MKPFVATYRLQLHAGFDFDAARGVVALPSRPRGEPPLPFADLAGTQGLDARLRRRRPDAHLHRTRWRGGFRDLANAGLGVILDVVPNHMAADDENPFWNDETLRQSSSTSIRRPVFTGGFLTSTTSSG